MLIRKIPKKLFERLTAQIGQGEQEEVEIDNSIYTVQKVKLESGFEAEIAFREVIKSRFLKRFCMWEIRPDSTMLAVSREAPLVFDSKPTEIRGWVDGKGHRYRDLLKTKIEVNTAKGREIFELISMILSELQEMMLDVEENEYWEVEINPELVEKHSS